LPDRTESLITGVGKFYIISLFETNYTIEPFRTILVDIFQFNKIKNLTFNTL
jgi:hypothetical protein